MIISGILGTLLGAFSGFFIGKFFHKFGNSCPILCNPKISTIYFGILGFFIGIN